MYFLQKNKIPEYDDFIVYHRNAQNAANLSPIPNRCKKKNIMLIKNLFSLFGGSHQDGRSDCAPDVIEEKEHIVIIPEKFKDDIQKLQDYCGVELRSGLCIEIELSELLEVLPRERRRKDSYDKLVKFLAEEMNVQLTIKSRNYENKKKTRL